jgi:hypothetical protein
MDSKGLLLGGLILGGIYLLSRSSAPAPAPGTVSPILSPAPPLSPNVIFNAAGGDGGIPSPMRAPRLRSSGAGYGSGYTQEILYA